MLYAVPVLLVTSTTSSFAVSFSRISVYGYCVGRLAAAASSRLADVEVIELARVVLAAFEL
jgi:hypothetical protein